MWTNTKHVPTHIRNKVLRRDNYTCQKCGASGVPLEVNHKIPLSQGGDTTPSNLETLCIPCHAPETRKQTRQGQLARANMRWHPKETHPGLK